VAGTADKTRYPQYAEGQRCANCALYGGAGTAQGPGPLFAGQQVQATGWCGSCVRKG